MTSTPIVLTDPIAQWEIDRSIARRRADLAYEVQRKGGPAADHATVVDVIRAINAAGYRIIDKDRIRDLHTSKMFTSDEKTLGPFPKMLEHAKMDAAVQMGRFMGSTGAIEFDEREGGLELRSTAYVIYPKPQHVSTRNEKQ